MGEDGVKWCLCFLVSTGPSKSELQRMQKYANQADDDAQVLPPGSKQDLGIGMMRLPGRNRRIVRTCTFHAN